MIYFLITASYFNNDEKRKQQYTSSILKLFTFINKYSQIKSIIIENNGKRETFFDNFGIDVFYTNNNEINTQNKGIKEIKDVQDCISFYNISDDDFIVKITGRYTISDNSYFMKILYSIMNDNKDIECIIRYGSYCDEYPTLYKMNDCVTGLIGMKCKYVKEIITPEENIPIEMKWAEKTFEILNEKIEIIQDKLGIYICPTGFREEYFLI
jgi:hypothetical protein